LFDEYIEDQPEPMGDNLFNLIGESYVHGVHGRRACHRWKGELEWDSHSLDLCIETGTSFYFPLLSEIYMRLYSHIVWRNLYVLRQL